ncbi:MAG: glycerol-3-phosphate dehydrogenase (NAD(P)+) [Parcubacteria group bacterium LiPW_41]|nr:MAG: glycerol-3-phosphate dehydrogenase (NAD(P)+) [Parcubacteria group bacterium LiPW_41]
MKKPHVVVLGMGEIGTVLFSLVKKRGYSIEAWDKVPQKVPHQKSLFEIIPKADILFLCIPSWNLPNVVKSIGPFIHKQTIIVGLAKGLQATKETPYTFLSNSFPHNEVVMLGGAMLAEEVALGMPGIAVFAGKKESARVLVKDCFKNTNVVSFESKDPEVNSFLSILKNVYALGLGIGDGIGWGGNGRALLALEALKEMELLCSLKGIKKDLVYGQSGFVDLIATGFSVYSKNVEVGKLIVSTKKTLPNSEGLVSLEPLKKIIGSSSSFPLFNAIYQAALRKEKAGVIFSRYIKKIQQKG